MRNLKNGKSRGFGYTTMRDSMDIDYILKIPFHIIDGKQVDCKIAIPKDHMNINEEDESLSFNFFSSNEIQKSRSIGKMFVGGIPSNLLEGDLNEYFRKYGKIRECTIMKDKVTGNSRGFGFIIFEEEKSVTFVMKNKNNHAINGRWIDCKRATPRINKSVGAHRQKNEISNSINIPPDSYSRLPSFHFKDLSKSNKDRLYNNFFNKDKSIKLGDDKIVKDVSTNSNSIIKEPTTNNQNYFSYIFSNVHGESLLDLDLKQSDYLHSSNIKLFDVNIDEKITYNNGLVKSKKDEDINIKKMEIFNSYGPQKYNNFPERKGKIFKPY